MLVLPHSTASSRDYHKVSATPSISRQSDDRQREEQHVRNQNKQLYDPGIGAISPIPAIPVITRLPLSSIDRVGNWGTIHFQEEFVGS